MSDRGNPTSLTINISQTHDFLDLPRETGIYQREVENGVVYTFTVEEGKIVKHEAVNREGKPLATSRIRIESVAEDYEFPPIHIPPGPKCYICTNDSDYDDNHQCYVANCDI